VISSGDESKAKEYIHPRAVLVGSLGRWGRTEKPVVFSTELSAFFARMGMVYPASEDALPPDPSPDRYRGADPFYAFRRIAYGMIDVRTDGARLVAVARSAIEGRLEAYAYELDDHGAPAPSDSRKA